MKKLKHIVSKEFTWDMAHLLSGHKSLCNNVHGHTYRMEVLMCRPEVIQSGSSKGMVMDFKDLKEIVQEEIVQHLDHAFVGTEGEFEDEEICKLLKGMGKKVFKLPCRTTAENMSKWIYDKLIERLGCPVQIKLWETPTSYAVYGRV